MSLTNKRRIHNLAVINWLRWFLVKAHK